MSNKQKRNAILKSQIEIARANSENFLTELAETIKSQDSPNLPVDVIRNTLTRGQHPIDATLRLLNGE